MAHETIGGGIRRLATAIAQAGHHLPPAILAHHSTNQLTNPKLSSNGSRRASGNVDPSPNAPSSALSISPV